MAATPNQSKSSGEQEDSRPNKTRLADQVRKRAATLTQQGFAKAGEFAETRKDQIAGKLDGTVAVLENLANAAGNEFGEGARDAVRVGSKTVAELAVKLRQNSVEDMMSGARTTITQHPGVALGVASLIGFLGGRIVKAGLTQRGAQPGTGNPQAGAMA